MTTHSCEWFLRGLHNKGRFVKKIMSRCVRSVVLALSFTSLGFPAQVLADVRALFDLSTPATSPFPSDWFTVPDASHNTRRRVNLPLPKCAAQSSMPPGSPVWVESLSGHRSSMRIPRSGTASRSASSSRTELVRISSHR